MFGDCVDILLLVLAGAHRYEEIEVANRIAPAAEGTSSGNRLDRIADTLDEFGHALRFNIAGIDVKAPRGAFGHFGGFEDVLFALFTETGEISQFPFAGELL